MNNNEYYESLNERLIKIKELRGHAKDLAIGIIGDSLFMEDLYFTSALDRSIALLDGVVKMLETRNLACVGILVRTQIDNCMRIFAAFIAEDKPAFFDGFFKGKLIKDFKDDHGESMSDVVLRRRLEDHDLQISEVYKKSSGYVHFSDVALHSSVTAMEENFIEFSIGIPIREEANEFLLEGADAFIHFVQLQFQLLHLVVDSKKLVDRKLDPYQIDRTVL